MHYGVHDYGTAHRVMHRVTLRGDRPFGPSAPQASAAYRARETAAAEIPHWEDFITSTDARPLSPKAR